MSNIDYAALGAEAVAEGEDHSVVKASGIPLPPEGDTLMRLVEYIELGEHVTMHEGKPKPASMQVRIAFELLGKKHIRTIEVDGKQVMVANRIVLPNMSLFLSEKSSYRKLFDKMADGDDKIKHMIQMVGKPFLGTVVHNKVGDKTYANLKDKNGFTVRPAIMEEIDPETGVRTGVKKRLKCPEILGATRGFLWNHPSREQWDTLFIDGEFEQKDEKTGESTTKSKNFIQNKIKSATNFTDSKIFEILGGIDSIETHLEDVAEPEGTSDEVAEEVTEKPKSKSAGKKANTVAPDDDELAAMGFID